MDLLEMRRKYYDEMLDSPIEEAVVVVDLGSRTASWDGYHRVAAAFSKGDSTVPAIVGVK